MKITLTDRDGNKQILEGDRNLTLMEIIRDEGIDIEAACGGCCACATCHVYVDNKWLNKIDPKEMMKNQCLIKPLMLESTQD